MELYLVGVPREVEKRRHLLGSPELDLSVKKQNGSFCSAKLRKERKSGTVVRCGGGQSQRNERAVFSVLSLKTNPVLAPPSPCSRVGRNASFGGSPVTGNIRRGGFGKLQQNQGWLFLSIDVMQTPQP